MPVARRHRRRRPRHRSAATAAPPANPLPTMKGKQLAHPARPRRRPWRRRGISCTKAIEPRGAAGAGAGGKVVDFPINDVARITIKAADGRTESREEGRRLDRAGARGLSRELRAGQRAAAQALGSEDRAGGEGRPFADAAPRTGRARQRRGRGTLVEFKDKDGKNAQRAARRQEACSANAPAAPMGDMAGGFPAGRYVKPRRTASKVSLVSETLEDVDAKPERWLNKDFIKIESPKTHHPRRHDRAAELEPHPRERRPASGSSPTRSPTRNSTPAKYRAVQHRSSRTPSFNDVLAARREARGHRPRQADDGDHRDVRRVQLHAEDRESWSAKTIRCRSRSPRTSPKERTAGKDEKPEDKAKLDEEFKAKQKRLEEKLAAEKKFEGRPYLAREVHRRAAAERALRAARR